MWSLKFVKRDSKMKKILCILLILCFAGCSVTEIPENTDINISKIESETIIPSAGSISEEGAFSSYDELAGYLYGNPEFREFFTDENGMICLCVPENLPEKYTLNSIKIHGSYITYNFKNSENPAEIFKLEWPFKVTDAEKFLQNSLNFTYSEIEERPGSYVSSVYSTETGEREAFKIIWVENGLCFSAIVSEEIFENFKNGTELVKKEIYD